MPRSKSQKIFSKILATITRGHRGDYQERKDVLTRRRAFWKNLNYKEKADAIRQYYYDEVRPLKKKTK